MSFRQERREREWARKRHKKHGYNLALYDVMKLISIKREQLSASISFDDNADWIKTNEERKNLDKLLNDIRQSAFSNDAYKSLRNKIKNRKLKK